MKTKLLILAAVIPVFSFSIQAAFVGIHAAAAAGDLARLKEYLGSDPTLISARNGPNRTPLCIAAMRGQTEAVEFLIAQGADVNDKGFLQLTPLADMAMYGTTNDQRCAEIATILLAHGAEVDPLDGYKATPLLHAVEFRKNQLARVLLENGAMQTFTYKGSDSEPTPLHMAIRHGDKEMVAVLLKFNPPLTTKDRGATPLLLAEQLNKTEIAAMLRQINPEPEPGETKTYAIPPTREAMRTLANRISDGDEAAFDELNVLAKNLYGEIKDYQKEHARVMVLLFRMKAAFDLLGDEAGNGNEKAFQSLKKCLGEKGHLSSFAPDALGRAAAAGNKGALDILLNYKQWHILDSSANFALCAPVEANVEPAVDHFVEWLGNIKPFQRGGGVLMSITNALASASAKGNQKAQAALQEFAGPPAK